MALLLEKITAEYAGSAEKTRTQATALSPYG
jgi:hypothetical protein